MKHPGVIVAVILMYVTVAVGAYVPVNITPLASTLGVGPIAFWVIILLVYAYIASTLPVQTLLQPRDYINSHQLFIALGLLSLGVIISHPDFVAPAANLSPAVGHLLDCLLRALRLRG